MDRKARSQAGNVFFTLFGAVGLVGVLGASTMTILKGPVKSMSEVTRRTIAENAMIASGKLALMSAINQADDGDCDADGRIEPIPFSTSGLGPKPTGGGYLPAGIGASLQDPWGNNYGYCVWDHGANAGVGGDNDANCGGSTNFLAGADTEDKMVLAVLSSGPNRTYEVTCSANPGYLTKPAGSDDIVLAYTYAEAKSMSGGVWNIEEGDISTAEIAKNLSVKDDDGDEQLAFDTAAKALTIGAGGSGSFPTVKTDFIQQFTAGSVEFLSNIKLGSTWLSGDGGNEGIQVDATGAVSTSGTITPGGNIVLGAKYISNDGSNTGLSVTANGNVYSTGSGASFNLQPRDGSGDIWAMYNGTGDDMRLWRSTGGDALTIKQNGNVGIGTTDPKNKLHVASGAQINLIQMGAVSAGSGVDMAYPYESIGMADAATNLRLQSPHNVIFHTGMTATEPDDNSKVRMFIGSSGNVGVGTDNPGSRLHVSLTAAGGGGNDEGWSAPQK